MITLAITAYAGLTLGFCVGFLTCAVLVANRPTDRDGDPR